MRISLIIAALLLGFGFWGLATSQGGLKFVDQAPSAPAEMASAAVSR